ncbi:MAG: MtrB/PioB family decaheme-associated outer membrane protein [Gammaproteobacteria bacterium]|nr:MtrB/PioB family decaheme-associated outer membrane protein [Gammaproteobacteria bacterium]
MNARQVVLGLLGLPLIVAAQTAPDTSDWECGFCAFPSGLYFDLDAGAGYVTDDSYRFGDYRGFDDEGAIFLGEFDLHYFGDEGRYWKALGRDLGLDSRSLSLEGGRQGRYNMALTYEKLPRQLYGQSQTPFSGFDTLTLPTTWITGSSTSSLTQLSNSLAPVSIGHERETLGLSLALVQSSHLEYQIDYRHEDRDGRGIHGGNFLSQVVLLPEPIDYATDEVDASIIYTGERGQARLNYNASTFNSKAHALVWDNPFNPLAPSATRGRAALPPDNQAHQLSLSGAVLLAPATRVSGMLAIGELEQDDPFVPYTINSMLAGTALPASALNGKVETRTFNLSVSSRLNKKLRVRANFDYDDRDNRTPRNDYAIVESDSFATGTRTNVPYSFQRTRARLRGDYRVDQKLTLSSGYRYREIERDFQEVRTTDEHSGWFGATLRQDKNLSSVSVKFGRDEREGSGYLMPGDPVTGQNPLLRKYNMADRDRDFVQASVTASPSDRVDLGLSVESSEDDYGSTRLGLLGSDSERVNLDASVRLSDNASLALFYGRELIESVQTGSATLPGVDWTAAIEDEIDTFSLGLRLPQINDKVDLGLEYLFSDSTGRIALSRTGASIDSFPDLSSRLHSARLYADFRPNDRYTVRAGYYYERLSTRDWMLDGLAPDSLPSVLALGAETPNYTGGVFILSFRYSLANGSTSDAD